MAQVKVRVVAFPEGGADVTVGGEDGGWMSYSFLPGQARLLPEVFILPDAHEQPLPTVRAADGSLSCQDLVIADIEERKAVGLERYGTLLYPHNGRDTLQDAYEEALDLTVYLRGLMEERRLNTVLAGS